jgi:hypothetical protein
MPPHAWQVPVAACVEQNVFGAVQMKVVSVIAQQGCDRPPHAPQAPDAQAPGRDARHVMPEPTQVPYTQQPPSAQVLFAQHPLPARPHCWQVPLPEQRSVEYPHGGMGGFWQQG